MGRGVVAALAVAVAVVLLVLLLLLPRLPGPLSSTFLGLGSATKTEEPENTEEQAVASAAESSDETTEVIATAVVALGEWRGIMEQEGVDSSFIETIVTGFVLDVAMESPKLAPLALLSVIWECARSAERCKDVAANFAMLAAMEWVLPSLPAALKKIQAKVLSSAKSFPKASAKLQQAFNKVRNIREAARALAGKATQGKTAAVIQKITNETTKRALRSKAGQAMKEAARYGARYGREAAAKAATKAATAATSKAATKAAAKAATAAATKAGAKAATLAAVKGAAVAAKSAATKLVGMCGGPVGIALTVAQLAVEVTGGLLDKHCVGNFADKCHPTPEAMRSLSDTYNTHFVDLLLNGEESSDVKEWAYVPRIDEDRLDDIKERVAREARGRVLQENIHRLTNGKASLAEWAAWLKTKTQEEQFSELMRVKRNLDGLSHFEIDANQRIEACKATPGARWLSTFGTCSVERHVCCTRADVTRRMFAYADADDAGMSAVMLAVFATEPERLVDLLVEFTTEMNVTGNLTREALAKWRPAKVANETRADRAVRLTLQQALAGTHVALLLAATKDPASAARGAVLRTYQAVAADQDQEDEPPALEHAAWPATPGASASERRAWLHSHPSLHLLSRRWVPLRADGLTLNYDVDHAAACGGAYNDGLCLPDYRTMMKWHVCPFVRAGEWDDAAAEHRKFDADTEGHVYDWKSDLCMPTTEYCEALSRFPTSTEAECTGAEKASIGTRTALFILGAGAAVMAMGPLAFTPLSIAATLMILSGGPKQCTTQRTACAKDNPRATGCTCTVPAHLEPFKLLGGETIVLGMNRHVRL